MYTKGLKGPEGAICALEGLREVAWTWNRRKGQEMGMQLRSRAAWDLKWRWVEIQEQRKGAYGFKWPLEGMWLLQGRWKKKGLTVRTLFKKARDMAWIFLLPLPGDFKESLHDSGLPISSARAHPVWRTERAVLCLGRNNRSGKWFGAPSSWVADERELNALKLQC